MRTMDFVKKYRSVIVCTVVVIICGIFGGYMYYKRTPGYTLKLIQESIKKHDYVTFSKHVDTKSILSFAYDDMVSEALNESNEDENINELTRGLAAMIKAPILDSLNNQIEIYIKTGEMPDESKTNKKSADAAADDLVKKTNLRTLSLTGLGNSQKKGDFSIIEVIVHDSELNTDLLLKLKAIQLEDGTWKVLKINNFNDFLKGINTRKENNIPIHNQINYSSNNNK